MSKLVTVAIVQEAPALLDLEATLAVVEAGIKQASAAGATLVAFGETFLSGYPVWLDVAPGAALWDHAPAKQAFAALKRSGVAVPGPATEKIGSWAAEHGVAVVIGANERVDQGAGHGTLYNALLTFDRTGRLVNHHRKLVPTYTERLVWGPGDAHGLAAADTDVARIGSLVCWEHWMPLARQALHQSAEQIHVAVWPAVKDAHHLASRHYAFEGRCFVLAAGQLCRVRDLPENLRPVEAEPDHLLLDGGSAIYGPDGSTLAGPVYGKPELLVATIDLDRIAEEQMTLDVTGHYHRPDLLHFEVKPGPER